METNKPVKLCNCFIRHAITAEERAAVTRNLDHFRSIGDTNGAVLMMAALTKCPSYR